MSTTKPYVVTTAGLRQMLQVFAPEAVLYRGEKTTSFRSTTAAVLTVAVRRAQAWPAVTGRPRDTPDPDIALSLRVEGEHTDPDRPGDRCSLFAQWDLGAQDVRDLITTLTAVLEGA